MQQINSVFGESITDNRIVCNEGTFREGLLKIVGDVIKTKAKPKRQRSNFMVWLDENRTKIKEEYFSDYESYDCWGEEGIIEFYESHNLPTEKLIKLIYAKKEKGKDEFKPRLCTLVTIKAGLIWGTMDDEEKNKYKILITTVTDNTPVTPVTDNMPVTDKTPVTPVTDNMPVTQVTDNKPVTDNSDKVSMSLDDMCTLLPKKKGRPKGKQPKNSLSDNAISESISRANSSTTEEVVLEECNINGTNYYKDPCDNVYDFDTTDEIGKIVNGSIVLSN